jgi:hypothetical protein
MGKVAPVSTMRFGWVRIDGERNGPLLAPDSKSWVPGYPDLGRATRWWHASEVPASPGNMLPGQASFMKNPSITAGRD